MSDVIKNIDEPKKNNNGLILVGKVKAILDFLLSLVKKPETPEIIVLPKSVRLAIAHHNSTLSKEEILSLLDPKFGFLGIWLVLKFYEDNKKIFFELIESIIRYFAEEKKSSSIWDELRNKLIQDTQEKQIKTTGKISFMSRMGFREFCEGLGGLYNSVECFDSVILVANSGLMGIETILQQLRKNQQELIIVFPKFGPEMCFYSVSFSGNHLNLELLNGEKVQDKFKEKKILVIDDISSSGKTEYQVSQILGPFSPTKIEFRTLIKFPDKREFMTDPHRGMVC